MFALADLGHSHTSIYSNRHNTFMHTTFAALHAQTAALKLKQVVDLLLNECLIRCRHQHETGQAVLCSTVLSLNSH